jgi:hypothetical protein
MAYKTVAQLTELNVELNKKAETFIKLATDAKAAMTKVRQDIHDRYNSQDYNELPRQNRQQMATFEIRKAVAVIQRKFDEDSKGQLRGIGKLSEAINETAPLYEPIRRLNYETAADADRAQYQKTLVNASTQDLLTLVDVFESTNNRSGLAALSSIVGGRDDKSLRKALPNARIVRNLKWEDQEQLDAVFKSGKHMQSICLEESRSVVHTSNKGSVTNGIDRIKRGLRRINVTDGKVADSATDIRQSNGKVTGDKGDL